METIKQEMEIEHEGLLFCFVLEFEVEEGEKSLFTCGYSIEKVEATDENNVKRLHAEGKFLRNEILAISVLGIPSDIYKKAVKRAREMADDAIQSKIEGDRYDAAAGE